MSLLEIVIIVCSVLFVGFVCAIYIYKRIKKKPIGECSSCRKSVKKLYKEYRLLYKKDK